MSTAGDATSTSSSSSVAVNISCEEAVRWTASDALTADRKLLNERDSFVTHPPTHGRSNPPPHNNNPWFAADRTGADKEEVGIMLGIGLLTAIGWPVYFLTVLSQMIIYYATTQSSVAADNCNELKSQAVYHIAVWGVNIFMSVVWCVVAAWLFHTTEQNQGGVQNGNACGGCVHWVVSHPVLISATGTVVWECMAAVQFSGLSDPPHCLEVDFPLRKVTLASIVSGFILAVTQFGAVACYVRYSRFQTTACCYDTMNRSGGGASYSGGGGNSELQRHRHTSIDNYMRGRYETDQTINSVVLCGYGAQAGHRTVLSSMMRLASSTASADSGGRDHKHADNHTSVAPLLPPSQNTLRIRCGPIAAVTASAAGVGAAAAAANSSDVSSSSVKLRQWLDHCSVTTDQSMFVRLHRLDRWASTYPFDRQTGQYLPTTTTTAAVIATTSAVSTVTVTVNEKSTTTHTIARTTKAASLPADILTMIFRLTGPKAYISLIHVNRVWKSVASNLHRMVMWWWRDANRHPHHSTIPVTAGISSTTTTTTTLEPAALRQMLWFLQQPKNVIRQVDGFLEPNNSPVRFVAVDGGPNYYPENRHNRRLSTFLPPAESTSLCISVISLMDFFNASRWATSADNGGIVSGQSGGETFASLLWLGFHGLRFRYASSATRPPQLIWFTHLHEFQQKFRTGYVRSEIEPFPTLFPQFYAGKDSKEGHCGFQDLIHLQSSIELLQPEVWRLPAQNNTPDVWGCRRLSFDTPMPDWERALNVIQLAIRQQVLYNEYHHDLPRCPAVRFWFSEGGSVIDPPAPKSPFSYSKLVVPLISGASVSGGGSDSLILPLPNGPNKDMLPSDSKELNEMLSRYFNQKSTEKWAQPDLVGGPNRRSIPNQRCLQLNVSIAMVSDPAVSFENRIAALGRYLNDEKHLGPERLVFY